MASSRQSFEVDVPGHQPVISSHSSQGEGTGYFPGKLPDNISFIFFFKGKPEQRSNPYRIRSYAVITLYSASGARFNSNIWIVIYFSGIFYFAALYFTQRSC